MRTIYGECSSFAVWDPPSGERIVRLYDLAEFQAKDRSSYEKQLKPRLRPDVMIVALNFANRKGQWHLPSFAAFHEFTDQDDNYADPAIFNVHFDKMITGTDFEGAYITDLVKFDEGGEGPKPQRQSRADEIEKRLERNEQDERGQVEGLCDEIKLLRRDQPTDQPFVLASCHRVTTQVLERQKDLITDLLGFEPILVNFLHYSYRNGEPAEVLCKKRASVKRAIQKAKSNNWLPA